MMSGGNQISNHNDWRTSLQIKLFKDCQKDTLDESLLFDPNAASFFL